MIRHKVIVDTSEVRSTGDEALLKAYKQYSDLCSKFISGEGKYSNKQLSEMYTKIEECETVLKGLTITTEIY